MWKITFLTNGQWDWYLDAKSDVIKQVQNDADNDMFKL